MRQTIMVKTHFLRETRHKPPLRGVKVSLHMENNSDHSIWFILPGHFDFPLVDVLENVKKVNLMKDGCDHLYLKVYGDSVVTLFRLIPKESISIPEWVFHIFRQIEYTEIWAVENIKIDGRNLTDMMADDGELAPPQQLPEGKALLKSLSFNPRTKLEAIDKTGSFDIDVGTKKEKGGQVRMSLR